MSWYDYIPTVGGIDDLAHGKGWKQTTLGFIGGKGLEDHPTAGGMIIGGGLGLLAGNPMAGAAAGGALGSYLGGDAAKGSNTAAAGMAAGAQQAQALSELEWQRQMQGLAEARSRLNPYRSLYDSIYGTHTAPPVAQSPQGVMAQGQQARMAAPPGRYGALLSKLNGGA